MENGDELTGTVAAITTEAVELVSQGRKLNIAVERLAAVAFDPSLAASAKQTGLRTLIGLADGSRLVTRRLKVADGQAEIAIVDKATWALPAKAIVFLQPLGGKAIYLSDLAPEAHRHLPWLSGTWPYRNDLNVMGTQLRAGGHPYAKGLGTHTAGRLTYRLDKRYRTFEAEAALDDHVGNGGAAIFAVYVDEKPAWKSDCLRGGMPTVPIKVDVTGAKRLSLIVEFAERGDELDRADWLNARLLE